MNNDKSKPFNNSMLKVKAARILKRDYFKNKVIPYLLHLFLPLDVDMQALEMIKENKRQEYLEEMYADNISYLQKLHDLQYLVNGKDNGASKEAKSLLQGQPPFAEKEGMNRDKLSQLSGITNSYVYQFFEILDRKESNPNKLLNFNWGIDKVNSLHDWYCALAECLRGEEACKE